jgi:hypothetical protein
MTDEIILSIKEATELRGYTRAQVKHWKKIGQVEPVRREGNSPFSADKYRLTDLDRASAYAKSRRGGSYSQENGAGPSSTSVSYYTTKPVARVRIVKRPLSEAPVMDDIFHIAYTEKELRDEMMALYRMVRRG